MSEFSERIKIQTFCNILFFSFLALEAYTADLFGKEKALFVPTGTMANLLSIMAHCNQRASEIIIGTQSHICLWEGGIFYFFLLIIIINFFHL